MKNEINFDFFLIGSIILVSFKMMKVLLLIFFICIVISKNNLEEYLRSIKNTPFHKMKISVFDLLKKNNTKFNIDSITSQMCPRSWSLEECRRCWPTGSTCPSGNFFVN
jgi:hypothetical protein